MESTTAYLTAVCDFAAVGERGRTARELAAALADTSTRVALVELGRAPEGARPVGLVPLPGSGKPPSVASLVAAPDHGHEELSRFLRDLHAAAAPSHVILSFGPTDVPGLDGLLASVLPHTALLVATDPSSLPAMSELWMALAPAARGHVLARGATASALDLTAAIVYRRPRDGEGMEAAWTHSTPFILDDPDDVFPYEALTQHLRRAARRRLDRLRASQDPRRDEPETEPARPNTARVRAHLVSLLEHLGYEIELSAAAAGLDDRVRARAPSRLYPELLSVAVTDRPPCDTRPAQVDGALQLDVDLDALAARLVDLEAHCRAVVHAYEQTELKTWYVPQRQLIDRGPDTRRVLRGMQRWLEGNGYALRLLLGDYGAGKSTLCQRYQYELASDFLDSGTGVVPVLVRLGDVDLEHARLEALLEHHRPDSLGEHATGGSLLRLLREGRIVLVLDGFDELSLRAPPGWDLRLVRQLTWPARRDSSNQPYDRILLTSRTHHFAELSDVADTLGKARLRLKKDLTENADVLVLAPLEPYEIRQYLRQRLGEQDGSAAWTRIEQTYDLKALAQVPVLLDMIVVSLPDLAPDAPEITTATLYETYTDRWLESAGGGRSLQTTPATRRRLLEGIAAEIWQREGRIPQFSFEATVERLAKAQAEALSAEQVVRELRSATFLVHDEATGLQFSHRSFLEYFHARHLLRCARRGQLPLATALDCPRLSDAMLGFFGDMLNAAAPSEQPDLATSLRDILAADYRPRVSENALRIALDYAQLRRPDRQLLASMLPARARLEGADLAEILVLRTVPLGSISADGANLQRARLSGDLSGASMRRVELRGMRSTGGHFGDVDLADAALAEAILDRADLTNARLDGADLYAARLTRCDLTGTTWARAQLDRATAVDCQGESALPPPPPRDRLRPHLQLDPGDRILSVDVSPAGDRWLTAGAAGRACIWDARTHELLRTFGDNHHRCYAAHFDPAGDRVACHGYHEVSTWSARTGELLATMPFPVLRRVRWVDDSRLVLAAGTGEVAVVETTHDSIHLLRELAPADAHARPRDLVCLPGGQRVAVARGNAIMIFDVSSGERVRELDLAPRTPTALAPDPTGRWVFIGDNHGRISRWDPTDDAALLDVARRPNEITALHCIDPAGALLAATVRGEVSELSPDTTDPAREPRWATPPDGYRRSDVTVDVTRDQLLCAADSGGPELIRRGSHSDVTRLGRRLDAGMMIVSADGRAAIQRLGPDLLRWDLTRLAPPLRWRGLADENVFLSATHTLQHVVTVRHDEAVVRRIDDMGVLASTSGDLLEWGYASPDGRRAILGTKLGKLLAWDLGSAPSEIPKPRPDLSWAPGVSARFTSLGLYVTALDFDTSTTTIVWNVDTGETVAALPSLSPRGSEICPADDGRALLVTRQNPPRAAVYSLPDGELLGEITLGSTRDRKCWSLEHGRLLVCTPDGDLTVHRLPDLAPLHARRFLPVWLGDARLVTPDRAMLRGTDGVARLVDLTDGRLLETRIATPEGWLTIDTDGRVQCEHELDLVTYLDTEDHSPLPRLWYAGDLSKAHDAPALSVSTAPKVPPDRPTLA